MACRVFESGAILIYLADKTGKLLPKDGEKRYQVLEWLMWQMGGVGPMLGQVHHFVKYNKGKAPYAEDRYSKEAQRLYGVLDRRLEGREFLADDYSIADIATWPWISASNGGNRPEQVPERETLVHHHRQPACRSTRLQAAQGRRRDPDAVGKTSFGID